MIISMLTEWPVAETLIAIAIILFLLDTFIATETLSHIAIIVLCIAIFWILDTSLPWRIAISLASWFVFVCLYYLMWKQVVNHVTNRVVAPTRYKDSIESIVGKRGSIECVDGKSMCRIGDALFPIEGHIPPEHAAVQVTELKSGKVAVKEN